MEVSGSDGFLDSPDTEERDVTMPSLIVHWFQSVHPKYVTEKALSGTGSNPYFARYISRLLDRFAISDTRFPSRALPEYP